MTMPVLPPVDISGWLVGRLQTLAPEGVGVATERPDIDPRGSQTFVTVEAHPGEPVTPISRTCYVDVGVWKTDSGGLPDLAGAFDIASALVAAFLRTVPTGPVYAGFLESGPEPETDEVTGLSYQTFTLNLDTAG
jgi:hypothetical protein